MSKAVRYKVWIHIEGLDKDGDMVEGDEYFEPREAACIRKASHAEDIRQRLLDYAADMA